MRGKCESLSLRKRVPAFEGCLIDQAGGNTVDGGGDRASQDITQRIILVGCCGECASLVY